jgi:hypothetical protein
VRVRMLDVRDWTEAWGWPGRSGGHAPGDMKRTVEVRQAVLLYSSLDVDVVI